MEIPNSKNVQVEVTNHAIQRFKERVDPTANCQQIVNYVRAATIPSHHAWISRYGLWNTMALLGNKLTLHYNNLRFIVRKSAKGKALVLITVLPEGKNDDT